MLRESPIYQRQGEPRRRWFTDEFFDIFVWLDHDLAITGFQLCYDKKGRERALTWIRGRGFRHDLIDDGELSPTKNRSPILIADGTFPENEILVRFVTNSGDIEERIRSFIIDLVCIYSELLSQRPRPSSTTASPIPPQVPLPQPHHSAATTV